MTPDTVVVTSRSFGAGRSDPAAALAAHGLAVVRADVDHDLDALAEPLSGAVAWIAGAAPVTAAHLERAPALRLLARYGTGVDAVDLDAARHRGVMVTNTPGANAAAVAEHTVALMLACLRHVVAADRRVRAGQWPAMRGRELGAATVGIIGLGEVGRRVADLVGSFGATVVVHDPFVDVRKATSLPLEALLARADVVTLHRPPGDAPVIDAAACARMRDDAVLINTARPGLVDEAAVAAALHAGELGAVGTDVVEGAVGAPSVLLSAPRTVVTPHCAAQTIEAVDRMGGSAVDEVVRVIVDGAAPAHRVA